MFSREREGRVEYIFPRLVLGECGRLVRENGVGVGNGIEDLKRGRRQAMSKKVGVLRL